MESTLIKKQVKSFTKIVGNEKFVVAVRYDDECGNGHNSFAITCETFENEGTKATPKWRWSGGGCQHEPVVKHFPELAPLIKWHLCSSDGPMHYVANTMYHASSKDCNGLNKGEFRSFTYNVVASGSILFSSRIFYSFRNWLHEEEAREEAENFLSKIKPELKPKIERRGSGEPSEGKEVEFDYARSSAIWPEATIEQLRDKKALEARLPKLLEEFKLAIESHGFVY